MKTWTPILAVFAAHLVVLGVILGCSSPAPELLHPAPSSRLTTAEALTLAQIYAVNSSRSYSTVAPTGSMVPTFDSRSVLLLEKIRELPAVGDIVVADEGPGRENVGHRVTAAQDDSVILSGDANHTSDGWVRIDRLKWRVAGILYTRR